MDWRCSSSDKSTCFASFEALNSNSTSTPPKKKMEKNVKKRRKRSDYKIKKIYVKN
jgi:hypothetical protein